MHIGKIKIYIGIMKVKSLPLSLILGLGFVFLGLQQSFAQSSTIRYTNVTSAPKAMGNDTLSANEREAAQLIAKGNAYHDNRMFREAIKCYKQADSLSPKNATVNYELGYSYMMLKQLDSAALYAKRSIEIEPSELAFSLVGDIYDFEEKLDSALKYYDLGLSFYPKSYHLLYNKGVALFFHKREDEAYEVAKLAVKSTRQHEGSYFLLAQISANRRVWIDFFANGAYANFVGDTKDRAAFVRKYFAKLMLIFKEVLVRYEDFPMLDIHREWVRSTVYRFAESESKFEKLNFDRLDSLDGSENDFETLVALGTFAMRESVMLPYEFDLKPFYRQIVDGGFEDVFMRVVFRGVNDIAFESWKMMNRKRFEQFYEKVVYPFWEGEASLKAPVLIDRPN